MAHNIFRSSRLILLKDVLTSGTPKHRIRWAPIPAMVILEFPARANIISAGLTVLVFRYFRGNFGTTVVSVRTLHVTCASLALYFALHLIAAFLAWRTETFQNWVRLLLSMLTAFGSRCGVKWRHRHGASSPTIRMPAYMLWVSISARVRLQF